MYANSQPNKWLDRSIWILGVLVAVVVLGFGGYYVRDRYFQPNVSLVERETKHLEELVQKDPQNVETRMGVAQAYLADKLYDQAIVQFQEVLKLSDKHAGAILGLGVAYGTKGDDKNALKYYGDFIGMSKGNELARVDRRLNTAYYEVGRIYLKQGNADKAIENLESALSINRADSDALYQLGTAYMQKGKFADAAEALRLATAFVPDFVEAYQSMAVAYDKNNEPAKGDYARAMVTFSTGAYSEAAIRLEKVVQAIPDFLEAHYGLAMAYDRLGQKDKAIEQYEKVVALDHTHNMAKTRLQQLTGKQK